MQIGATFDNGNGAVNYNDAQLSRDGTRLCTPSCHVDSDKGIVKVYERDGSSWVQMGSDFIGVNAGDNFGYQCRISSNGDRVAVSVPWFDTSTAKGLI